MAEILTFINNTTEIDSLGSSGSASGIILLSWEPALAPWKEISTTPFLSDGSNLLVRNFEDITETMTFGIAGTSQNDVTTKLQNFIALLELGVAYEMGNYDYPTYIKVKPNSTTNTSYGRIKKYKIDKIPQVIGDTPFSTGVSVYGTRQSSGMPTITIAFSIPWYQDVAPGSVNTTLIQTVETFATITRGTVDSAQATDPKAQVFVAPKYNVANITHAFRFDTSASSFSANLVNAALPQSLYPSPIGVGDILYLGCQIGVDNDGPITNIAFDIGTAASAAMTLAVEYHNGTTWASVSDLYDGTVGFSLTGVRIITFTPDPSMTTVAINSVTAAWIRIRIAALNGNSTIPTQVNRNIYSVTWSHAEIPSTQIKGQIPALISLRAKSLTNNGGVHRLVMGLRKSSRGTNFRAYWNAAITNPQNPSGITVDPGGTFGGGDFPEAVSGAYPSGRGIEVAAITGTGSPLTEGAGPCTFTIDSSVANQYRGKFKAFLGIEYVSISGTPATSDLKFSLTAFARSGANSVPYLTTGQKPLSNLVTGAVQIIDMGEVEFIPTTHRTDLTYNDIIVRINHHFITGKIYSYNAVFLALIPSDEYVLDVLFSLGEITEDALNSTLAYNMDGTTGKGADSYLSISDTGNYYTAVNSRTPRLPTIHANAAQAFHMLNIVHEAHIHSAGALLELEIDHIARYLTCLRGIG